MARIGLVAHDDKKDDLVAWANKHRHKLSEHELWGTGTTGGRMLYENVLQLRGKAGPRQVKDASLALSHNIGGHPTACGIAILGKS